MPKLVPNSKSDGTRRPGRPKLPWKEDITTNVTKSESPNALQMDTLEGGKCESKDTARFLLFFVIF